MVTGRWDSKVESALVNHGIDRLVLNYALGFEEPSLDFLKWLGVPLRSLTVLDRTLDSIEPIYSLAPSLEVLDITTSPRLGLDLSAFPQLHDLSADWGQIRDSIVDASKLVKLFATNYSESDLRALSVLPRLEWLMLKDRPRIIALDGLSSLNGLRSLLVPGAGNLIDIGELSVSPNLVELDLESCRRISALDPIAGCRALVMLNISELGEIESLNPLRCLRHLRELYLYGSTKPADNDLSPLLELEQLTELRMMSRRSYAPRVAEVKRSLGIADG